MSVAEAVFAIALAAQSVNPLDLAARTAESFWGEFTTVQSVERVTQNRLQEDGKVVSSQTAEFDYVAVLKVRSSALAVEESRVPRSNGRLGTTDQFLLTSGFPTLLLMFHPDFRGKFDFWESPADDMPAGSIRIAFKSKSDERSMSALRLKERLYPILWRGFAWIDPATGSVIKIDASLASPMEDLGLSELRAEVEYRPAALRGSEQTYRLPSRVTISVRTPKQRWQNVHEFSGYRLFTVSSSIRKPDER
jgi:hypothetical protein